MSEFNHNRPQRQSFDVSGLDLSCANCGTKITELPFQPTPREDGSYGRLYCRECNAKRPHRHFNRRGFGR